MIVVGCGMDANVMTDITRNWMRRTMMMRWRDGRDLMGLDSMCTLAGSEILSADFRTLGALAKDV